MDPPRDPVDPFPEPDPSELELTRVLESHRPVPSTGFRRELARHLLLSGPRYGPRPARLRLQVTALLTAGLLVLLAGVLVSAH